MSENDNDKPKPAPMPAATLLMMQKRREAAADPPPPDSAEHLVRMALAQATGDVEAMPPEKRPTSMLILLVSDKGNNGGMNVTSYRANLNSEAEQCLASNHALHCQMTRMGMVQ